MMRALLHLPRSNAHSPNVKQSAHLGQNTKPAKNATTWLQQQQALHTEEAEKTEKGGGGAQGFMLAGPSSGNS